MKWIFWLPVLLMTLAFARASGPDDQYVHIYSLIQQGETLQQNGQLESAAEKFREAEAALVRLQRGYPAWNEKVVRFRLSYLAGKLRSLPSPKPEKSAEPQVAQPSGETAGPEEQIKRLSEQIRWLEAQNARLEDKLKEAFSVEPGSADPRLAKAEEKIAMLEKERDLLKVSLEQARTVASAAAEPSPREQKRESKKILELEKQRAELQQKLEASAKRLADLESRYDRDLQSFRSQSQRIHQLEQQREELQARLAESDKRESPRNQSGESKKLKELEQERKEIEKKLNAANKQLAEQESSFRAELNKFKATEQELRQKLETATRDVAQLREGAGTTADSRAEVERLRARLEVYEAKAVPFTPEELALFRTPETQIPAADFTLTSSRELPADAKALLSQANRDFTARRFEEAERKYTQVLGSNDRHVYTLANLASAQLELNRLDEAERSIRRALEIESRDAFSLLLLGKIKMGQGKFDEALDALSQAARLNPQSAETHNALGIALSERGQRAPAEAALRKAIQLQPDYASAHHNLAIIYATQNPPFVELARWHYQKAVKLGHARNDDLEKVLKN